MGGAGVESLLTAPLLSISRHAVTRELVRLFSMLRTTKSLAVSVFVFFLRMQFLFTGCAQGDVAGVEMWVNGFHLRRVFAHRKKGKTSRVPAEFGIQTLRCESSFASHSCAMCKC
jgi:hypothetical protein